MDDTSLARQFDAHAPDTAWVTDITYIKSMEGFADLAVVMDLPRHRLVTAKPIDQRSCAPGSAHGHLAPKAKRPYFQSDQGSKFTKMDWASCLRLHNLVHSMSRRGKGHDNAVAESFFSPTGKHVRNGISPGNLNGDTKGNPEDLCRTQDFSGNQTLELCGDTIKTVSQVNYRADESGSIVATARSSIDIVFGLPE